MRKFYICVSVDGRPGVPDIEPVEFVDSAAACMATDETLREIVAHPDVRPMKLAITVQDSTRFAIYYAELDIWPEKQ